MTFEAATEPRQACGHAADIAAVVCGRSMTYAEGNVHQDPFDRYEKPPYRKGFNAPKS